MTESFLLIGVGVVVSYLLGGIPVGYLMVKALRGIDIRTVGSGNIGATNVGRVLGRPFGILAFVLDVLKGLVPTCAMAALLGKFDFAGALPPAAVVACGAAAICGHIWTPYLKFRGGKGVATSCGVLFYLSPIGTLAALAVWIVAVLIWRYVSLGSILAAVALVVYVFIVDRNRAGDSLPFMVFALLMAVVVIVRHRSNIKRLLAGTENRIGARKAAAPARQDADPDTPSQT